MPSEPAYLEAVGVKLEGNRILGVRTPDWKLLKRANGRVSLYKLNGGAAPNEKRNLYRRHPEVVEQLEAVLENMAASEQVAESGMTSAEEEVVEKHLKDLGYL